MSVLLFNEMLNKAFALAYFIHGDSALPCVSRQTRCELDVATSAQHKRLYYKPTARFSQHQRYAKRSKSPLAIFIFCKPRLR